MQSLVAAGPSTRCLSKVLASSDRLDGSRYFAFDIDPRWVTSIHEAYKTKLVSNQAQLAGDILEIVSDLHELDILLNLDPVNPKEDLMQRFFIDAKEQHVYLFGFSRLAAAIPRDTSAHEEEITVVVHTLQEVFPSIRIQDTAARTGLDHTDFPSVAPATTTESPGIDGPLSDISAIAAVFTGSL
jgi:hypothetical protein